MNIFNVNNKRGYTLMEIMVTVIIIGILAAAGLPYYKDHVERQKASLGITNLRTVSDSVDRYMALHNQDIPSLFTKLDIKLQPHLLSDDGSKYNDGNFTFTINSTQGKLRGKRNTNQYTLVYSFVDDTLSCESSDSNFCCDKLNMGCH